MIDQISILKYEKKKSESVYGHDKHEWGPKDDSEELEWERHYEARREKWNDKNEDFMNTSPLPNRTELPLGEYLLEDLLSDSLLSSPAVSIREEDPVSGAVSLLPHHLETFTDSLVVTKQDKPIGLVGGIEILDGVLKEPSSIFFDNKRVGEIMSSKLIVLGRKTKLSDLLNEWRKIRRAFAIIPNQYHGYSVISARKILEVGAACVTDMKVSELPKKRIVFFRRDSTVGEIIKSMFENKTRKLVLENSEFFISDRIIIEKIVRELNCLRNMNNFLDMSADVFKLDMAKRIPEDLTIPKACKTMCEMSSPYLITNSQVISPWDVAMVLDTKN